MTRTVELGGVAYVGHDGDDTQGGGGAHGRQRAVDPTSADHVPRRLAANTRR